MEEGGGPKGDKSMRRYTHLVVELQLDKRPALGHRGGNRGDPRRAEEVALQVEALNPRVAPDDLCPRRGRAVAQPHVGHLNYGQARVAGELRLRKGSSAEVSETWQLAVASGGGPLARGRLCERPGGFEGHSGRTARMTASFCSSEHRANLTSLFRMRLVPLTSEPRTTPVAGVPSSLARIPAASMAALTVASTAALAASASPLRPDGKGCDAARILTSPSTSNGVSASSSPAAWPASF